MNCKTNRQNNVCRSYSYKREPWADTTVTPAGRCGTVNVPDGKVSLAMVYTVSQCWRNIYTPENGLETGTIFDELNKPFAGDKCVCGCTCLQT